MSVAHITGGVSHAQAQQDRYRYEITLENARSGITSIMEVYALSEKEARDSVIQNGWRIISMKQVTFRESIPAEVATPELTASDYQLQAPVTEDNAALIDSMLGKAPATQNDSYQIPSRVSLNAPDNALTTELLGEPTPNARVVIPATPAADERYSAEGGDYPTELPDPANLSLMATIHFDLGIIEPTLSAEDTAKLAALDKTKSYYLYGHADNVSVGENASYKDNLELSELRAKAVQAILSQNGINPANIKTAGLGALYPVVVNSSSAAGTAQNRRVEIYEVRTAD